ncbi:hypothetical protein [Agromyces allii]|uniref:Alpha/beta hydrolase n=1 Tax=Agromyces allii TaxID=393607 RepID=A0ABP5C4Z5_9MICO|nr:hypothetical protein [Agromyces allii]
MSDDLTVSGGGSTAVAIDALFADASRLASAEAIVQEWIEGFAALQTRSWSLEGEVSVSGELPWPGLTMRQAGIELDDVAARISSVRLALEESAERYGETERFVGSLWDVGGSIGATLLGFLVPLAVGRAAAGLTEVALPAMAAFGVAKALGGDPGRAIETALEQWLVENRGVLNDPAFVRLVRTFADHADEFVLAALRVPGGWAIGPTIDAPESASMILGAAGLLSVLGIGSGRTLVDGPVRVQQVTTGTARDPAVAPPPSNAAVPPPDGYEDLVGRIPPSDGEAQITVERFVVDGENRFVVYIGGTVDFTLEAGAETNDMSSNVHGIADDSALDALRRFGASSAGAERAVRQALAAAGAEPGDPILAVGHSGGGVIAAGLAADPELEVVAGVNFGGPVASAPIPPGVPFISAENEDDPVPATAAAGHPSHVIVVSRRVHPDGYDGEKLLPAHQIPAYGATAAMMDDAADPGLVAGREQIREFTAGTIGERTRWHAERVEPEPADFSSGFEPNFEPGLTAGFRPGVSPGSAVPRGR